MRSRHRIDSVLTEPATAVLSAMEGTTKIYYPECEMEPIIDSASLDLAATDSVQEPLVLSGSSISYGLNQRDKKTGVLLTHDFQPCHHIRWKSKGRSMPISILQEERNFETFPYEGCSTQSPMQVVDKYNILFLFNPGTRLGLGNPWPDVLALNDPFLDKEARFEAKLNQLDKEAWDEMSPSLDNGFSLPVFLWELADLRSMLRQLYTWLRHILRLLVRIMHRPLRELAGMHLSYIFGWAPFVRDFEQLTQKILTCRTQVEEFISGAEHRKTYHFRKRVNPKAFVEDDAWYDNSLSTIVSTHHGWAKWAEPVFSSLSLNQRRRREIKNLTYCATMEYQYSIGPTEWYTELLGILDVFGVNISPSDLWEIIPFSFVVDWFLNIGNFLERFDLTNLPARLEVFQYCRSIKYDMVDSLETEVVELDLDEASINIRPVQPNVSACSDEYAVYHRFVGLPHNLARVDGPDLTLPSGMQVVSGLSLLVSNIS